jgi:hypothetical protein
MGILRAMHAPRRLLVSLVPLLLVAVMLPSAVVAATTQQVASLTSTTYKQTCVVNTGSVTCTGPTSRVHMWNALITPPSGSVTSLRTDATMFGAPPMDPESIAWMKALHSLVCGDSKGANAFVDKVAALGKPASVAGDAVGVCTMTGNMQLDSFGRERYRVTSSIRVTPSPSPPPTAAPTAVPTAPPTASPKPTTPPPKPTAAPTPTTAPTRTATDPPAHSLAPSIGPSAVATLEPTASPSLGPSPGPTVVPAETDPPAAANATPGPLQTLGPAPTEPAAVGPVTPAPSMPTFSASVLGVSDVNADVAAIGGSLLLALLLLLIIGFAGELFNNTVENNYTEISGWFRKGPLGAIRGLGGALRGDPRVGLLLFLVLTALISSFVDPYFGLDLRSFAVFLGFLVGLIVVLASFKLPVMLARRRKTGELGRLRPLPWALVIAALFVLISRIGNLQPGYLYGIVLGAIFVKDVSDREEGRETFYGSLWTLGAAVLAWLGLNWVRSLGYPEDGFGVTLLSTAFAAILVAGLEAAAFGLMPLRFMPGHAVYKWNRVGWAFLFGLSVFAFIHLLIGPTSGYVADLAPEAFMAALGIFAAFGALSIGTWAFFRFRSKPTIEAAEAA